MIWLILWLVGAVVTAIFVNRYKARLIEEVEGGTEGLATAAIVILAVFWPIFVIVVAVKRMKLRSRG